MSQKPLTDFYAYGNGVYRPVASAEDMPRTAGELRRRLAELGNPWTVDPRLRDDDPLPEYPMGSVPAADQPAVKQANLAQPASPGEVPRQNAPANPFLRRRWAELGRLGPDEIGTGLGTKAPDES